MRRVHRVEFASAEEFQREHNSNLASGGVFVETEESFELREQITLEIHLSFCNKKARLDGEIVHIVPPELASAGARPGVAVQFLGSTADVSKRLQPLANASGAALKVAKQDPGRRVAPRVGARVPVKIAGSHAAVEGTTRNLSNTGVLVSTPGGGIDVGQRVQVSIQHPTTGEEMSVEGTVVRQVETGGTVAAVGIHFDEDELGSTGVRRFVEDVQNIEHTRRLGGIAGPIEELGPQNLLQMFGNTASAGTLVLRNGEDEGLIGFQNKLLRYARLGTATGMKALVRLLAWQDGSFEFSAHLEPEPELDAPMPLEAALMLAMRELDELERIDHSRLPLDATVTAGPDADVPQLGREPLSKVENAVLDLARAGFTVQRMIDVIPEADPEILRALETLADQGVVRFVN